MSKRQKAIIVHFVHYKPWCVLMHPLVHFLQLHYVLSPFYRMHNTVRDCMSLSGNNEDIPVLLAMYGPLHPSARTLAECAGPNCISPDMCP